jgi:hypothetical protein
MVPAGPAPSGAGLTDDPDGGLGGWARARLAPASQAAIKLMDRSFMGVPYNLKINLAALASADLLTTTSVGIGCSA